MRIDDTAIILYKRTGYQFKNVSLLRTALTHSSYDHKINYQRLEFLGDGILHAIVCDLVYNLNPIIDEGVMSRIYAKFVNSPTLASIARTIDLGQLLLLEKSEEAANGRDNQRNLENAMEALIGAVYLDSGYDATYNLVKRLWSGLLAEPIAILERRDYKSILQEWSQKYVKTLPIYTILGREGPAHAPMFTIQCSVTTSQFKDLYGIEGTEEDSHPIVDRLHASIPVTDFSSIHHGGGAIGGRDGLVSYTATAQGMSKKEAEQRVAEAVINLIRSDGRLEGT